MDRLDRRLRESGHVHFEGHCGGAPEQLEALAALLAAASAGKEAVDVLEIGFNAGNSSFHFLSQHPGVRVTSFDLGEHAYVAAAKRHIDEEFPGRHTLLLGDSRETVPRFAAENKGAGFDFLFIDGGHDYPVALADLLNCRGLAREGATLVMDDTVRTPGWARAWTVGPTRAWDELLGRGALTETARADFGPGRGQTVGAYAPAGAAPTKPPL